MFIVSDLEIFCLLSMKLVDYLVSFDLGENLRLFTAFDSLPLSSRLNLPSPLDCSFEGHSLSLLPLRVFPPTSKITFPLLYVQPQCPGVISVPWVRIVVVQETPGRTYSS